MPAYSILVNTWPTKNTPWVIRFIDNYYWPLREFIDHIKELPDNFESLPENYWGPTSLPRYYLLIHELDGSFSVVGVKYNLERTNWHITITSTVTEGVKVTDHGWYHPEIKEILLKVLEDVLQKMPTDVDLLLKCILEDRAYPCNPIFKTR
jgi:hypothetical protein